MGRLLVDSDGATSEDDGNLSVLSQIFGDIDDGHMVGKPEMNQSEQNLWC